MEGVYSEVMLVITGVHTALEWVISLFMNDWSLVDLDLQCQVDLTPQDDGIAVPALSTRRGDFSESPIWIGLPCHLHV